jgi:hypothetical protein
MFDDDICVNIGLFTVSIKLWVTQYFSYLMISVVYLFCNLCYIAVRQSTFGEKIARSIAKKNDEEIGLPFPLYMLVLEHWILNDKADEQTLSKLAQQNAEDELAFLAAKRKRLEQELQEVGDQIERSAEEQGQQISGPTLVGPDRRRVTFMGKARGGAEDAEGPQGEAAAGGSEAGPSAGSEPLVAGGGERSRPRVVAQGSRSPSRWGDLVRSSIADALHGHGPQAQAAPSLSPEPEPEPQPEPMEEAEPPH